MEQAYTFLKIAAGQKKRVLREVRRSGKVAEARLVLGAYDAVVRIEGETIEDLERVYFNEIESVSDVVDSVLYIVACPRARK